MNTETAKGIAGMLKSLLGSEQKEEPNNRKINIPYKSGMKTGGVKKR
jgi:hypothetical protein